MRGDCCCKSEGKHDVVSNNTNARQAQQFTNINVANSWPPRYFVARYVGTLNVCRQNVSLPCRSLANQREGKEHLGTAGGVIRAKNGPTARREVQRFLPGPSHVMQLLYDARHATRCRHRETVDSISRRSGYNNHLIQLRTAKIATNWPRITRHNTRIHFEHQTFAQPRFQGPNGQTPRLPSLPDRLRFRGFLETTQPARNVFAIYAKTTLTNEVAHRRL